MKRAVSSGGWSSIRRGNREDHTSSPHRPSPPGLADPWSSRLPAHLAWYGEGADTSAGPGVLSETQMVWRRAPHGSILSS